MAEIANTPYVMKNCVMNIEDDDYAAACSGIVFTPTASMVTFQGLKPDAQHTDVSVATWALDLSYAQDLALATSLSNYLHANEGLTKAAEFIPDDGGPSVTADIIITPGAIGGQGGAIATSSVKLGVKGKPAIVPVTP